MNGTVVLDEVICHIQRIYLKDGLIWVYAVSDDGITCNVMENAEVSVFDSEGALVLHAPSMYMGEVIPVVNGRLYVDLPLDVTDVTSREARP